MYKNTMSPSIIFTLKLTKTIIFLLEPESLQLILNQKKLFALALKCA